MCCTGDFLQLHLCLTWCLRSSLYVGFQTKTTFLKKSDRTGQNPGLEVNLVVVEAVSGELVGDVKVHLDELSSEQKVVASHDIVSSSKGPATFRFNPPEKAGGGRFFLRATVMDKVQNDNTRRPHFIPGQTDKHSGYCPPCGRADTDPSLGKPRNS